MENSPITVNFLDHRLRCHLHRERFATAKVVDNSLLHSHIFSETI